tara:strand:- start:161 stop:835 length:675 start_codon:yes stop_codon:yes gene_type:complete
MSTILRIVKQVIFELNPDLKVRKQYVEVNYQQSVIYIVDNFYKDPEKVSNLFWIQPPDYHDREFGIGYNREYFQDLRHQMDLDISHVWDYLSDLCGQEKAFDVNIQTNVIKFRNHAFNDYENNYWWPHYDYGYTGLVYLNEDDEECGTNLYQCLDSNEDWVRANISEHSEPWRSKDKYKLLKTLKPKYNRLVLFDGKNICHGQHVTDKYFGDDYRLNQVFFFKQ